MSSPGQKRGDCCHVMASFDSYSFCAFSLTADQRLQLATLSYKLKKEKRGAKKMEASPSKDTSSDLIDPATVSVLGAVNVQGELQSPSCSEPSTKKQKKGKSSTSKTKTVQSESKLTTESKIAELDQKWWDRFNRLEALLMARTLEPTFGTVKVTPSHSPPAGVVKDSQPFNDPAKSATVSSERTGKGFSATKHSLPARSRLVLADRDLLLQSALEKTSLLQSFSLPASSRPVPVTLRRWEKSTREVSALQSGG